MRKITKIILHCTGTVPSRWTTVDDIRRYHVRVKGWKDIGYHYFIDAEGVTWKGRDESSPGAHCEGHNKDSIGVCYCGGLHYDCKTPMDTRTDAQKVALYRLCLNLIFKYNLSVNDIHAHYEYARKDCPCFKIEGFRAELLARM